MSALNAALELARGGYTQEIGVLMRTVTEFTNHIKFVLTAKSPKYKAIAEKYVEEYFADSARVLGTHNRAQVRENIVHEALEEALGKFAPAGISTAKLSSNVYLGVCYYVHGRYPEIMDLYGGIPGRFHCRGMSGTPKDMENLATLETFIESATTAFVLMVQALNLKHLIEGDPILTKWYSDFFETSNR